MATIRCLFLLVACYAMLWVSSAFGQPASSFGRVAVETKALPPQAVMDFSSSTLVAADPIDPTSVLTQAVGGLMGSPAILAVPIVAAIVVATAIAAFITGYASPAVEDDEE